MKKLATILFAMCVLAGTTYAADVQQASHKIPPTKEQLEKMHRAHEAAFEQKLGLTEVQKLKARELRKSGFEKIKPVMDQLGAKKQEAEAIRRDKNLTVAEQETKLTALDKDIAELKKQAAIIRKQNMKDFESILTRDQRKTLKQMKKEGRARFEKERNLPKPPCPNFTPEK